MPIIDISAPLSASTAPWPGDTAFTISHQLLIEQGASVNLGSISMSLHCGTHVDAPWHFQQSGAKLDAVTLEVFVGPATVVDVSGYDLIDASVLERTVAVWHPRLLLRTSVWLNRSSFPSAIPTLTTDAVNLLAGKGVILLGLDLPSVDEIESKQLPIHHALYAAGINILESVWLESAELGSYELIALPLSLVGADASPVRAILRY
jgi:arylformamidase